MAARHSRSHGHAHAHRRHAHRETIPLQDDVIAQVIPHGQALEMNQGPTLLARESSETPAAGADGNTLAIALGVAIPLALALGAVFYFHRRSVQRQRREDMMEDDKYKSMDFGDSLGGKAPKRRSVFGLGREKEAGHRAQLSMDMNLSSPYLLPPTVHQSRESLAKNLGKGEDPYRPVTDYASDVSSLRSASKAFDRGSSIYTSRAPSMDQEAGRRPPPRQNSLPQQPSGLAQMSPAHIIHEEQPPILPPKNEFRFTDDDTTEPQIPPAAFPLPPTIQEPPSAVTRDSHAIMSGMSRPMSEESLKAEHHDLASAAARDSVPVIVTSARDSQQSGRSRGSAGAPPRPPRTDSMPAIEATLAEEYVDYPLQPEVEVDGPDVVAGYASQQAPPHSAGLGIPQQDNKRLSIGLRPLPPDEMLDSEDPEFRANRIRSFYKEYFEDYLNDSGKPPPPVPQQADYYEDYDSQYLGDAAAYFDPETNAFVMPYSQPVTRRAMTPPPNSRRPMPGPKQRGPPRGPPGSYGARPRAGSTMSAGRWGPAGAMSPRPGSSASNPRFGGKPRKPMPPPAELSTLPTPSKLRDDSFALTGAIDFAPPPTFRDQASGRSQSPIGERRPYQLNTPIASPLVSSFDETAALPSPHLLRKSGTFTGLDFAPPRRFKDPDTMSDAGSIRSNNSGISQRNAFAIRNGAGRVSRLPGDTVFTQVDMADTLKPNWGIRP